MSRPAAPRAHSRSRRENRSASRVIVITAGSSPLTRGKQQLQLGLQEGGRLIPAHAGKTTVGIRPGSRSTAHPRSRGENEKARDAAGIPWGSSPLTRGKHLLAEELEDVERLIPAHAGKTDRMFLQRPSVEAHPRSRGENRGEVGSAHAEGGSSPLTRGKRRLTLATLLFSGLIPAHAGKTHYCLMKPRSTRAHPRSRGENGGWDAPLGDYRGSSPLTRGKLARIDRGIRAPGLIPAHAGKTPNTNRCYCHARAHPRSRGENVTAAKPQKGGAGSSPLTRGKPPALRFQASSAGLIPAQAGKTGLYGPRTCGCGAHPRSRGENGMQARRTGLGSGSSPLTRGKQVTTRSAGEAAGLIPAHAGKTSDRW